MTDSDAAIDGVRVVGSADPESVGSDPVVVDFCVESVICAPSVTRVPMLAQAAAPGKADRG